MTEEILRKEIRTLEKRMGLIQDSQKGRCCCCFDVNFLQCHMITELGEAGILTSKELSIELNVDKSIISRSVKELKNKGYIDSKVNEMDKRNSFLFLTESGMEMYKSISDEMGGYYSDIIGAIPSDKLEQIIDSLRILNESICSINRKECKCDCEK